MKIRIVSIIIIIAALILPVISCSSGTPKTTASFPPPQGYASWEEYNASYNKSLQTTAAPTGAVPVAAPLTVESYVSSVKTQSDELGNAFIALSDAMLASDVFSDNWKANVAEKIRIIKNMFSKAIIVEPPVSMKIVNNKYLDGLTYLYMAVREIEQGIDLVDVEYLNQSQVSMDAGISCMEDFEGMMEALGY